MKKKIPKGYYLCGIIAIIIFYISLFKYGNNIWLSLLASIVFSPCATIIIVITHLLLDEIMFKK